MRAPFGVTRATMPMALDETKLLVYFCPMKLTAERRDRAFAQGQTWAQFLESMKVNRPAIEANYAGYQLSPADRAFLAGLPGVTDVLVLAHDWCGDVVANLPLFAKIEAETGKLRLHIVPKDPDNVDIGRLYPHADGDVHIPLYVFFDAQGREKGHLIERTPALSAQLGSWITAFWDENPNFEGRGKEFSSLAAGVRGALLARLGAERSLVRDLEKRSILEELGRILG
jgi:hypothetical protein